MNLKTIIHDIETLKEFFLVSAMDVETGMYYEFEVNKNVNQLNKFIRFTEAFKEHYWVGYNNLRFDSQVIEWILRNYEEWEELGALEVCAKIAQKAADVIHDANYEVLPEFSEYNLSLKQIDLFKINHFDNKNRLVSLKRLQFEMDLENIEEMPIHHNKENLTDEDIVLIKDYCKNDIFST